MVMENYDPPLSIDTEVSTNILGMLVLVLVSM